MSDNVQILIEVEDRSDPVWTVDDLYLDDDPPANFDAEFVAGLPHLVELVDERQERVATITVTRQNPHWRGADALPGIDPPPQFIHTTATVWL